MELILKSKKSVDYTKNGVIVSIEKSSKNNSKVKKSSYSFIVKSVGIPSPLFKRFISC